jgi:ubiquinone/menaquinone biosynthesis C-methylase UbiE
MSIQKESYRYYDKTAMDYERIRFQGLSGKWGDKLQNKILSELLTDYKDKKILEVGCGTGRCTKMMLEFGCKNITAIEPAEAMLDLAKKRCGTEIKMGTVKFFHSDIESMPKDTKRFDVVIFVNVFSRLPDSETKLKKLANLISENGILVFNFQCLTSILLPFGVIVNRKNISLNRPVYSKWYTPKQIINMLRELKLVAVKWSGHHYLPAPKYLSLLFPAFVLSELILRKFTTRCFPSLFVSCTQLKDQ